MRISDWSSGVCSSYLERLFSIRLIDSLFHSGSSFFIYPYRVVFLRVDGSSTIQVLLSVAKRRFRHAVRRNLLKRRMRECYRLQKGELLYPAVEIGRASCRERVCQYV